MTDAAFSSLGIAAYMALFFGVGLLFIFVNLLVGRFLRPHDPHPEKLEIYECGEPTIGSSFVQFDLRFYVVALLFIIFDVEVAFFFPWATVFGKANTLADREPQAAISVRLDDGSYELTETGRQLYRELGVVDPVVPLTVPPSLERAVRSAQGDRPDAIARAGGKQLAGFGLIDIAVFFGVLLLGFAYVWKRGDLDWVRATSDEPARTAQPRDGPSRETLGASGLSAVEQSTSA
jgi:NADH-quinone oxidoreductase subunit A